MTTDPIGGGALVERWFLRMMLVVSIVAWLALLLAEAGQFRLVPILLIVWGGGLILLVFIRFVLAAAAGILLCAMCALLLLTPYETAVAAGDASVYLNFGRQIARYGAIEFEDPLLRPLSPADRAALFRNQVPLDMTGPFARFPGGFQIPDIAEPTVTAGFSPLFPVLTALAHALGPPQLALLVAPIFAILSLIGLWCVARPAGRCYRRVDHGGPHGRLVAADLVCEALAAGDGRPGFRDGRCARLAGRELHPHHGLGDGRRLVLWARLFRQGGSLDSYARRPAGHGGGAAPDARTTGRPPDPPGLVCDLRPLLGP